MGEKRSADDSQPLTEGVKALIVDIEGTTTPISFVHDTLFPHVKKNLQSYLEQVWDNEECKADVEALRKQAETDKSAEVEGVVEIPNCDTPKDEALQATVNNVLWQMSKDRKTTALKQLQGHMWKSAYESEEIKGEVYDDVAPTLKKLTHGGMKVYVYSSGSVEAQKLLFGHSNHGDLQELFSGNFDTKIGAKGESDSYKNICAETGHEPNEVLFLTDVVAESQAAVDAGLRSALVLRPGNKPLSDEDKQTFQTLASFSELLPEDAPAEKVAKVDSTTENGSGDAAATDASESAAQENGDAVEQVTKEDEIEVDDGGDDNDGEEEDKDEAVVEDQEVAEDEAAVEDEAVGEDKVGADEDKAEKEVEAAAE